MRRLGSSFTFSDPALTFGKFAFTCLKCSLTLPDARVISKGWTPSPKVAIRITAPVTEAAPSWPEVAVAHWAVAKAAVLVAVTDGPVAARPVVVLAIAAVITRPARCTASTAITKAATSTATVLARWSNRFVYRDTGWLLSSCEFGDLLKRSRVDDPERRFFCVNASLLKHTTEGATLVRQDHCHRKTVSTRTASPAGAVSVVAVVGWWINL